MRPWPAGRSAARGGPHALVLRLTAYEGRGRRGVQQELLSKATGHPSRLRTVVSVQVHLLLLGSQRNLYFLKQHLANFRFLIWPI